MNIIKPPTEETQALVDVLRRALKDGPRAVVAHCPPTPDADDQIGLGAQLAFALTVAAEFKMRVGLFIQAAMRADAPAIAERAREFDPNTAVGILTEENASDPTAPKDRVTLITYGGKEALLSPGGRSRRGFAELFDVIIAAPGCFLSPEAARDKLTTNFTGAYLILIWTAWMPSGGRPPRALTKAGPLTTFDASHLGDGSLTAARLDGISLDARPVGGKF